MPTVIDSFIITLGLDPSGFTKGQKEAGAAFIRTRDEAVKTSKEIEEVSKRSANSIQRVARETLVLLGAIAGSRSLADFIGNLNTANTSLAHLSHQLQANPQRLAAWGMAVERVGGNASNLNSTFERLSQALFDLRQNGTDLPKDFWRLESMAKMNIRRDSGIEAFILDLGKAVSIVEKTNPNQAYHMLKAIGLDEGTATLLQRYGPQLEKHIKGIEKLSPSNEALKASSDLISSWTELQQRIVSVGNEITAVLGPIVNDWLVTLNKWIEANKEWLQTKIVDAIKSLAEYIKDFYDYVTGDGFDKAAEGFGKVERAASGLFATVESIVRNLAIIGSWFTGEPTIKNEYDPSKNDDWKKKMGLDPNAPLERPLHPDVLKYSWNYGGDSDYNQGNRVDLTSDGRPVNRGNPVPVTIIDNSTGSGGFLSWLFGSGNGGGSGGGGGSEGGFFSRLFGGGGSGGSSAPAASGPNGIDYQAKSIKQEMGISDKEWNAYREGLTDIEGKHYNRMGGYNNRYAGRYQLGPNEIKETAARLGVPVPSQQQFLSDPAMQERFFENYTLNNYRILSRNPKFRNMSPLQKLQMLGYSHNQGAGGGLNYLKTGVGGRDGWGFDATKYFGAIERRYNQMTGGDLPEGLQGAVTYSNKNATRNQKLNSELERMLAEAVTAVYGPGARADVYSGGQPAKGTGGRRKGTTAHDLGKAADAYIYGADGKRLSGDSLAPLAQYWMAMNNGGVGLEMDAGGIHLDMHRKRNWWYGRRTRAQMEAIRNGRAGIMPDLPGAEFLSGAKDAAAARVSNNNVRQDNSQHTQIGQITVNAPSLDTAEDVANNLGPLFKARNRAAVSNYGLK